MALVEETTDSEVNRLLSLAKARNPRLIIGNKAEMFKDPTIFYKDDNTGALHAFSKRDTFWTWSFATQASITAPTRAELQAFFQTVRSEVITRFGNLPFSAVFSDRCPFINELTANGTDLSIVDRVVVAINNLQPGLAVRLNPAQNVVVQASGAIEVGFGLVYAHTVPLRIDMRNIT